MGDPSGPIIEENGGQNGDTEPSSLFAMGPPSPLTGCYLLIIIGEPHSAEHKDIILQRLVKGFLSWDALQTHVDLEDELNTITVHAPEGEDARHGERLIQYASENLVTEILIHPQYNTLIQCMRNLLSSFTRHRHIIHAGYTFSGNGSWILQDGTFSVSDFAEAFQEHDVQRVLRAYPDTVSMDIHCDSSAGLWNVLPDKNYAKTCKIRINPVDVLDSGSDRIKAFIDYLAPMLNPANLNDLLESSDVVGNIRFSHPTLYVFPGGQGDAALFGINGFNMLVDGGFNRKSCFWNFARHLDRLDAVLMTRISNSNIQGISSMIEKKSNSHVYPGIGHFFCNIPERRAISSPDENKDKDSLVIDLFDKGQKMISNLKSISLKPQMCYREIEPMNLYHKVGHGTLDMYVISPGKDSREVKEFMQKWTTNDQKLFTAKDTKDFQFPIQNLVSICALLVWQPANPEETITRILFPGSTPDYKIMEGLEKIKHLEFMKYPMCTAKKLVPSISTATITKKVLKSAINEKSIPEPILPSKTTKAEKDNQVIDNKVKNIQDNKAKESKLIEEQTVEKKLASKARPKKVIPKKVDSLDEKQKDDVTENKNKDEETVDKPEIVINGNEINETEKKDETDVAAKPKKIDPKTKIDPKATIRSRIDSKPPKSMDKKIVKRDTSEKKEVGKHSPTTTPKKTSSDPKLTNGAVPKEKEIKPKITNRVMKSSPSSTPAKSTKEANNRKVLESKQKAKTVKREVVKTIEKKEEKIERKPISHRTKGVSPSRRPPDSPKKSIKPKTEKDNIIRKAKLDKGGTTDSSLVSTPSADDGIIKKIVEAASVDDVVKQRELDDLKEEQEAVREIEEVFKREEKSKKKDVSADHREVAKQQDSATEAEDDEEYLIIEKEEVEQYTEDSINEQESSMAKEEEMQKHQRDSQESEKKRKSSLQTTEEEVEPKDGSGAVAEDDVKHVDTIEQDKDVDDVQPDSIEEVAAANKLEPAEEEHIKEEVQEIISSAKEIAKTKSESKEEAVKTEEISSLTPEDKLSSTKKTSDDLDPAQPAKDGEVQNLPESQPFSTTIESGATTAPTLPEDERIPLDEIKEDLVVEEKYIKEETKETKEPEIPTGSVLQKTYEPLERAVPSKMTFDTTQPHLRDIVKTPDEVADLPVHEEADIETYEGSEEAKDDKKATEKKTNDASKEQESVNDVALDAGEVEPKAKTEKIPNGSVVNKAENEKVEDIAEDEPKKEDHDTEEKEEDQACNVTDDKPIFDKKVEVTEFKEKDSTMAEKVEYAVEDLGKSFENTLKDVTHKDADKIQGEKVKEDVTKDSAELVQQQSSEEIDETNATEIVEGKSLPEVQEANQDEEQSEEKKPELSPKDGVKDFVDRTVSGVSSFMESASKALTDTVESLMETTNICEKTESELKEVPAGAEDFKEVFDYSHPYGLKTFPTELRETHITTLDSPVAEKDKIIDLKILDKLPESIDEELDDLSAKSVVPPFHPDDFKYASFEREDSNLKDIKEEEDEDRSTPPNDEQIASRKESAEISDLTNKDTITFIALDEHPPRAVSPREEEVLKIVANVAEVLKSEKNIAEIIPDFSEEELERKLRGASPRLDDESVTVQRMLVTTSSEDGGEEIEICPEGTIKFIPACTTPDILSGKVTPDVTKDVSDVKSESADIKSDEESSVVRRKESLEIQLEKQVEKEEKESSDPSTPEAKTSSISIDEKEKHELPEKAQVHENKTKEEREIVPEKSITESASRKESVVSDFIDDVLDRRESAFSAFSERDLTKDESSMDDSRPPSAVSHDFKMEKDEEITIQTQIVTVDDQSPEEKSVISKDDIKPKEDEKSSTLSDLKVEVSDERRESAASHVSDKSGIEISRPESIISHFSDRSEPELKEKLGSSPDSITSIDRAMAYMKSTTKDLQTNEKENNKSISRPESAASHTSDADKTEEFDTFRASSVISPKSESMEEASKKSVVQISKSKTPDDDDDKKDNEKESRPTSAGSHVSDERETTVASRASSKDEKPISRPQSIIGDKSDVKDETSRPPSNASIVSNKEEIKTSEHGSRPESEASLKDVKEESPEDSQKTDIVDEKDKEYRPPSAVSHGSNKVESNEAPKNSRPESVASEKNEALATEPVVIQTLKDSLKDSRPQSAASNVSDKQEGDEKPRPASATSSNEIAEKIESIDVTTEELIKESRASSAVSHFSDQDKTKDAESVINEEATDGDLKDSRPPSVAVVSRPESAGSLNKEAEKRPETADSSDKQQEVSRSPSVASHLSEKPEAQVSEEEIQKDSRSPSAASHLSDKKDITRPESVLSDKCELEQVQKDSRSPSVASERKDDVSVKPKDESRSPSVASHLSEKPEAQVSEEEKQKDSRSPSAASHTSDLKGQAKDSRPPSVSSERNNDVSVKLKDESRSPSVASHLSEKQEAQVSEEEIQKDSRSPSAASHLSDKKDITRPESVLSDKCELEQVQKDSRSPSVASERKDDVSVKPKDESRSPSVASHLSEKPEAQVSEEEIQKDSRSPSAASHTSDKKDITRPESVQSDKCEMEQIQKDSRPPYVSSERKDDVSVKPKDESRSPSVASHLSEKPEAQVSEEEIQKDSRSPSAASHTSDKKDITRPESVQSDKCELEQIQKDSRSPSVSSERNDDVSVKHKDESRSPSVASHLSEKPEAQVSEEEIQKDSRSPSAASHTSDKKDITRPESVQSDKCELEQIQKDSRPPSVSSERKDDVSVKPKDDSRSPSVASHLSEKPEAQVSEEEIQKDSRSPSAASHTSDKKDITRPESVQSDKCELEQIQKDSRSPSVASERKDDVSVKPKDDSRSPSVASHISEKPEAQVSEEEIQKDSRSPSAASHTSDKKDITRPESVQSDKCELEQIQKDSRPPSVSSERNDDVSVKPKDESRSPSVASHLSEKPEAQVSEEEIQKDSRSPSAASHTSDKKDITRPESVQSDKCELEQIQKDSRSPSVASERKDDVSVKPKDESRSPSVASHISEKPEAQVSEEEIQKDSRSPSAASHLSDKKDITRPESVLSDKCELEQVQKDSRSPSVASERKDDISVKPKDESRSPSVASHFSEKPEAQVSEEEIQKDSRSPSAASHLSDKKDITRPESVLSDKCELEQVQKDSRSPSVASERKDDVSVKPKDDSRSPSVASHFSEKPEAQVSEEEIQKDSRSPSAASHLSDKKDITRPESVLSDKCELEQIQKDSRPPSVSSERKDDVSFKPKDESRSPSVASHLSEKPEAQVSEEEIQKDSRSPSAASHTSDKKDQAKDSRPPSVSSERKDDVSVKPKDESRSPSVASHFSEKPEAQVSEEEIQKDSRSPSAASHLSDKKDITRPESVLSDKCELEQIQKDSRPPSVSSERKDDVSFKPKDESRSPSVASHLSEKPEAQVSEEEIQKDSRSPSAASHTSDKKDQAKDSRPPSVSSERKDDVSVKPKDESRSPSVASHLSEKPEAQVSEEEIQKDSRSPSAASHTSDKKDQAKDSRPPSVSSERKDDVSVKPKDDSRSPSVASHISDKDKNEEKDEKHKDSRPASVTSNRSNKSEKEISSHSHPDSKDEVLSRPHSQLSIAPEEAKADALKIDSRPPSSASQNEKDQFKMDTESLHSDKISRPASSASNKLSDNLPRPDSVASHVSEDTRRLSRPPSVNKGEDKHQVSRPASVASNESENENSQRIVGDHTKAEDKSQVDKLPISDTTEKEKDSRPASVVSSTSGVHDKDSHLSRPASVTSCVSEKDLIQRPGSAASQLSESRSQSRRESAVERCTVDDDDEIILKVKDARSKSVSSIMMTSMYKPEGFEPMATFEENFEQSKDDTMAGSSSRKASDLTDLIDDVKKIDAKLSSSQIEYAMESSSSISPENEISDKISTETIHSDKSSPSESKLIVKLSESIPCSSLDAPNVSGAESLSGKTTPDVADIENKILETFAKTTETTARESQSSKQVDVTEDHDFDHISITEKVSKAIEVTSTFISEVLSTTKSSSPEVHTTATTSSIDIQSQFGIKDGAANKDVTTIKSEFRSYTPSSDDFDINETNSPRSDVSVGHVARVVCGWTGSDDEMTNSPLSTTSQAPCSPPSKFTYETEYELQRSSSGVSKKSEFDIDDSQDDMPPEYGSEEVASAIPILPGYNDPMKTSVYGKLPGSEPIPITTTIRTVITKQYDEYASSGPDSSSCVSHESVKSSSDHRFLDEADLDFEKALEEHRQVIGSDVMSSVTSKYEFSPLTQPIESAKAEFPLSGVQKGKSIDSKSEQPTTSEVQTKTDDQIQKEKADERVSSWGKPLGLPSPLPVESQTTPKRERKLMISKTKMNNEKNLKKRSESPIKGKKVTPIYMDLTYVPHNGNSYYSHVEFFKRVRARYYVFSGTEPSRDVYNALLEAKQTWEDKELEVTIIPTYDTDVLGYWVSENEDLLAKYHIDLSPSASRCTINLQDHETSCSAYRLEF